MSYFENARPLPGFLLCEEVPDYVNRTVEGLGTIRVGAVKNGLYIPPTSKESDPLKGRLLVVRKVGPNPDKWNQRFFKRERDWQTTFEEQKITDGTLLSVRKVAGKSLSDDDAWVQIRYDEVCAIGIPFDEDYPVDMRPCPGWIGVHLDGLPDAVDETGLWIQGGYRQIDEDAQGSWATVTSLPRGFDELAIGDRVLIPSHEGVGATEIVEFGKGLRFLPYDDVLAIEAGDM